MDDIKLYLLCKVMNPIAMRGEPVQNFVDIRGAIEDLGQFTPAEIDGMESEWKSYIRMCQRLDVQENDGHWKSQMDRAVEFWKNRWPELTSLHLLALYCFTITASSAAAERVFSVLKHSLSLIQMHSMLEDLSETTIMCQYNHRKIAKSD